VVVSVNHRLGVLGYLELSDVAPRFETSVNAGMLDLVLALQWVRDNVAKFGGDADRVTIYGHSGGGSKVSTLMAMPAARGLFHRGLVMSGSPAAFATPAEKRPLSAAVMAAAHIKRVDELQQLKVEALLAAGARGVQQLQAAHGPRPHWEPARDGIVVTEDWGEHAPTLARGVPLMVGNVRDEFRDANVTTISDADFSKQLARFGTNGEALVHSLQQMFPQATRPDLAAIANALTWRQNAVAQATKQAANEAPVFNYWFVQPSPLLEGRIGVPHGTDVDHFFDNVSVSPGLTGFSPTNYRIADEASSALLAFAATGSPSVPGLAWTHFEAEHAPTMVFDAHTRMVDDPAGEARRIAAAVPVA
jgi:para-nitrobenzyl esterase